MWRAGVLNVQFELLELELRCCAVLSRLAESDADVILTHSACLRINNKLDTQQPLGGIDAIDSAAA